MSLRFLTGRLGSLFWRTRRLRGFDADVEAHLSLLTADLERQGLSPEDARREARRQFGGIDQTREAYRDASGFPARTAPGAGDTGRPSRVTRAVQTPL